MYDEEELKEEEEVTTPEEGGTSGDTTDNTDTGDTTEGGSGDQSDADPSDPSTDPVEDPDPVEPTTDPTTDPVEDLDPVEPTPDPEPEPTPDPEPEEVDPEDDPAVVVNFNNYTATKMHALVEKAQSIDEQTRIDMVTSQVLNRVKAKAAKGESELDVSYDSATIDFKEEYRTPVKNQLTSLGYTVTENMKEDVAIGLNIQW